jgi:hypothetical protein
LRNDKFQFIINQPTLHSHQKNTSEKKEDAPAVPLAPVREEILLTKIGNLSKKLK